MPRTQDKYANLMTASLQTAGVTVASVEIQTGVDLGAGKGILIDQIDYMPRAGILADFIAGNSGDFLYIGWFTQNPTVANDFTYANNRLIHMWQIERADFGTAGNAMMVQNPNCFQFFPPMIVASPRLYLACYCDAAIDDPYIDSKMYFRYVSLSSQEYLELAESFVLVG